MQEIDVRAIADFLGVEYNGPNFQIKGVCSATRPRDFRVSFINHNFDEHTQWNSRTLYLVSEIPNETGISSFVVVDNPRFSFARVSAFLAPQAGLKGVHKLSSVGSGVLIGENVSIGPFTVIEDGALIGDNVVIENNVTISTTIEKRKIVSEGPEFQPSHISTNPLPTHRNSKKFTTLASIGD
jgi:UDP-3-O-[3-hydroxymyristoyl] glucosamine N-acyltransferase